MNLTVGMNDGVLIGGFHVRYFIVDVYFIGRVPFNQQSQKNGKGNKSFYQKKGISSTLVNFIYGIDEGRFCLFVMIGVSF